MSHVSIVESNQATGTSLATVMHDLSCAPVSFPTLEAAELESLLSYFKQIQQVDLTGYKHSTLVRRTLARMRQVGAERYQDYFNYLRQEPEETSQFLSNFFINVTQFFRDQSVWDHLAQEVIPTILACKQPHEPIRVWSAGCASGEETYSLAMLLADALGIDQFQQRVRLYGTDIDPDAVQQAERGYYTAQAVEALPVKLRERYFERVVDSYLWRTDLRRPISFHCRDLTQDAPIPRIDLLVCRNLLMYFTEEAQIRALVRFHFSLRDDGFLVTGKAEQLSSAPRNLLFKPVDRHARVFTKAPDARRNVCLMTIAFRSTKKG